MQIFIAAVPPLMKNGFVVSCEETREAVLIDPGDEVDDLLVHIRREQLRVVAILLTHAHFDHITGVGQAKQVLDVPIWLHRDDLFLYEAPGEQAALFGMHADRQPAVDRFYEPDTRIAFGRYIVEPLHTPGHSPGGVCLAIGREGETHRELFVGDTLFAGSIGRTDLPGADHDTLLASIVGVLLRFPDEFVVYAGHGPQTTIGQEKRTNPFIV
jgi:glyoxylase-like metal-dependent hydrolase (beta-lactamase superfamily II)